MAPPDPALWINAPLREGWLADPLALDAAFQAVILWSVEQLHAPCLPAFVAEYRQYRATFPEDGVRVAVQVTERRGSQVVSDVTFHDRLGRVVAQMFGAECTVDAGLAVAFRQSALASASP